MADPVVSYLGLCEKYGRRPSADILVWIRIVQDRGTGALIMRPKMASAGDRFSDMDMLPFCDFLSSAEPFLMGIDTLDLSRCTLGLSSVLLLCHTVLCKEKCGIRKLILKQVLGSIGAEALVHAVCANHNIKELLVSNCALHRSGGIVFEGLLSTPESHGLTHLDLRNNVIPFKVCEKLEAVSGGLVLDTAGNRVFDEVLNSVSHGAALVLAIVGTPFMGKAVRHQPALNVAAVTLYLVSLIMLFLASTLYHGFFTLGKTQAVLSVLDHSAIYLLIAGSYTPCLAIVFNDSPTHSQYMLGFIWFCALVGICVTAFAPKGRMKKFVSLTLYLGMGWVALVVTGDLMQRVPLIGLQQLVLGGILYSLGVPFFIKNGQTLGFPDHTMWHMFVLAGAFMHYWFILNHVVVLGRSEERAIVISRFL